MTLFRQFFSAHLKGLLIWMAVAALMAFSGTRSAPTFIEENAMASMPKQLLMLFGDLSALSPIDMYVTILMGKGTPLIPTIYAVIVALSIVTREVDRRTVEFLLALPVQRTQVLLARLAVLAVNVTAVIATTWVVIRFDLAGMGYQGSWDHLLVLFSNLWLLAMAFGTLTLAASMWIDDYSVGVKLTLGFVALAFLVEYVLRGAEVSRVARTFSPFSYLDISSVMRYGSIGAANLIVLAAAIAAGVAVSFWAFGRKQFSA